MVGIFDHPITHFLLTSFRFYVLLYFVLQPAAIGKVLKGSPRLATAPSHPLDPLTFSELEIVRDVLISAGKLETGKAQVHGGQMLELYP